MIDTPRTVIEQVLCEILSEVLKTNRVCFHDSFFLMEDDPTIAVRIASRVREIFKVELPHSALSGASTVARIADHIEKAIKDTPSISNSRVRRIHRNGPLPLSFSQERIWFLQKLDPKSAAHNSSGVLRLLGRLDVSALSKSLDEIVRRHESLRSEFAVSEGKPAQIVRPAMSVPITIHDLREKSEIEGQETALELLRIMAKEPFDLDKMPLFRFHLCRLGEAHHLLGFSIHHIISDTWSLRVLLHDLMIIYNSFVEGKPHKSPEPAIQGVDIAAWQRDKLQGNILETQLAFWMKRLDKAPTLELHTDRSRSATMAYRGAIASREIPADLFDEMKRLSEREGVAPFMTFCAAFLALLYRYTGQEDISVGVPTAGRKWRDVWDVITSLENVLVLRTDISGGLPFLELVHRVHDIAVEAVIHQDVAFAKLVTEIKADRDPSRAPLFQAKFRFIDARFPESGFRDLDVSFIEFHRGSPQLDVACTVVDTQDMRHVQFEYNAEIFDNDTIVRMMGHFENLMRSVGLNPCQTISELSILDGIERRQLLNVWNDTDKKNHGKACTHQLFEIQTGRTPDAVALMAHSLTGREEEQLSYSDLNCRANQLALHLGTRGVGLGTRVGVFMERTTEMLVGLLGIMKAGGTYVPLDPDLPMERLSFIIRDAAVEAVITQSDLSGRLPIDAACAICVDAEREAVERQRTDNVPNEASPSDLAYVIYTSGSTGSPKGIAISHGSLANFLVSMVNQPGITDRDTMLATTTISFDPSTLELFLPIISGARLVMQQRAVSIDGALMAREIERIHATIMQATPSRYRVLIDSGWQGSSHLKLLCGGEPLTPDLAEMLLNRGSSLWNMYGPTETTVWSSVCEIKHGEKFMGIGRPIANMRYYILDKNLKTVPIGVPGELCISGFGLSQGYTNNPELTGMKFVPFSPDGTREERLYRTGDIVRCRGGDGNIEYLHRVDSQVKLRGYRIELLEIEAVLQNFPGIRSNAIVVREVAQDDRRLVGYVVPSAANPPSERQIRGYLKERLPEYMVPSAFVFLNELPLTNTGKVDRVALSMVAAVCSTEGEAEAARPKDPLETRLMTLWEEVLGKRPIGINENFFDLGGHSLLAIRLLAKIEQAMNTRLAVDTIFRMPTIEGLADVIRRDGDFPVRSLLVPMQPNGSKKPFFCVHEIGGNVFWFLELTRLLGPEQPFYGIRAQGLRGDENPHTSIPEMASDYIQAIRTIQPEGPYFIGGYSFGGLVAFEIAQQLTAQGKRVELLAIFDEHAPRKKGSIREILNPAAMLNILSNIPYWIVDFRVWNWKNLCKRILHRTRSIRKAMAGLMNQGDSPAIIENLSGIDYHVRKEQRRVIQANIQAYSKYVPRRILCRVVLFRLRALPLFRSYDPAMGWKRLAGGGVEIRKIPGTHVNIFKPPIVEKLARQLQKYLSTKGDREERA